MTARPEWIDDEAAEMIERNLGRPPTDWEWAEIEKQTARAMDEIARRVAGLTEFWGSEPGEGK